MKFKTTCNGEIEYSEKDVLTFKKGIPGFKDLNKFVIAGIEGNDVFKLLQSIENPDIALVIVSPFDVMKEYEVELNEEVTKELSIEKPEDVVLYNVVTVNSDVKKITANFMAPIVINISNNFGEQLILEKSPYKIKQPIFRGE